jgi:uncharacterized damage-inducible protein DinB
MNEPILPFIRDLFRFNRWACDQLMSGVRVLSHAELYRTLPAGWKNLNQILVHIHAVEALQLERCHNASPEKLLDPSDFCGVEDVSRKWETIHRNTQEFLENIEEADLEMRFRFNRISGESVEMQLVDMLLNTVIHSIFHRGQVQYLLRSFGHKPKPMDPLVFFLTHSENTVIPQSILRELAGYTRWAEERTYLSLKSLDADKLHQSYDGGLGSAWETQVHVIATIGGWLERMDGEPDFRMMDATDIDDLDELDGFLNAHLHEMENITRVREDLTDRITIQSRKHSLTLTRAQLIFQLITHAVYHRGQTLMMVRFAGGEPHNTDFATYAQSKVTVNV